MGNSIRGYVGKNGGGKTLAMIEEVALPSLARGRPVYSTVRVGSPDGTDWFENCYPLVNLAQLLTVERCAVLIDEITSSFPARQAMVLPPDAQRLSNQLRKGDIEFAWTAPNWMRADKMFREVTQEVTVCRSMVSSRYVRSAETGKVARYDEDGQFSSPMFPLLDGKPGGRVRWPNSWPARELFRFKTYNAEDFEEFSLHTQNRVKAIRKRWYVRRRHKAWKSYSTLEEVVLLAHLDESGICVACGGTRTRPKCVCPRPDGRGREVRVSAPAGAALRSEADA